MILLALATALAGTPEEAAAGNRPGGHRMEQADAGSGAALAAGVVLGQDGGTSVTSAIARYRGGPLAIQGVVPVGWYRTPSGRTADLGNVRIAAWHVVEKEAFVLTWGAELHVSVGQRAYTWVNRPDELWPGAGAELALQVRSTGRTALMGRISAGLHGARGYEPFPPVFPHFGAVGAIDQALHERIGVVAELAAAWWDTSPLEVAALARVDLLPGLRVRSGVVLPIGVWAGFTTLGTEPGVREATWLLDLSVAP